MADDLTDIRSKRPELVQEIEFSRKVKYYKHSAFEDKVAILVCQIKIWKPEDDNWFDIPSADSCTTIRECESIEIANSCKDLISKAVIKFPRGTVISVSSKKSSDVKSGNSDNDTLSEQTLKSASNNGDVITKETSQYSEDGVGTTSMAISYDDKGLLEFNRTIKETALLRPDDIATGNRIEIRLGYAYSDKEFKEMNTADSHDNLVMAFTGFVTAVSPKTPLEIECTNMAHVLNCISAPNVEIKDTMEVKDFLDDNGQYPLLKDTGIPLAECSKGLDITVLGGTLTENLTVADVFSAWSQGGILCMLKNKKDGSVELQVGRNYNVGLKGNDLPNQDRKYITYNPDGNLVKILQFDWDVAEDKLNFKRNDKKYLAINAFGWATKDRSQYFKLTVRKNVNLDDEGWVVENEQQEEFQIVNQKEVKEKKASKKKGGTKLSVSHKLSNKVDLSQYTVLTYQSTKVPITQEELIEEAKQYYEKCAPNGISGSISIFGDLDVQPADIVGLVDIRQPEKNGYYFVESVNTTFGINGYRRELHLPYKIASYAEPVVYIP